MFGWSSVCRLGVEMIRSGVIREAETFISKTDLLVELKKLLDACECPKCEICVGLQIALQKVKAWNVQ